MKNDATKNFCKLQLAVNELNGNISELRFNYKLTIKQNKIADNRYEYELHSLVQNYNYATKGKILIKGKPEIILAYLNGIKEGMHVASSF